MSVGNDDDKEKNGPEEESARKVTSTRPWRFGPADDSVATSSLLPHSLFRPVPIPGEQYVVGEEGTPERVPTPRSKELNDESVRVPVPVVKVRHPSRSATFYSVTEDEIDNYAQFTFLSSIALTLFGVFAGFTIGCVVALIQGDLSETSIAVFWALIGLTAAVTVIFLVASIHLYRLGGRTKKTIKSSITDKTSVYPMR